MFCLPVSTSGIYTACVLSTALYNTFFVPFWAWRSATLIGSTGSAFTVALQTTLAQVGGIIAPQVFQSNLSMRRIGIGLRLLFIRCVWVLEFFRICGCGILRGMLRMM